MTSHPGLARYTLVSFHAHPDDEALLTAGTLARAAAEGHRVVIVVATAGEAGAARADWEGAHLGDRRIRELEASAAAIGAARVEVLGYPDTGWPVSIPGERTGRATDAGREVPFSQHGAESLATELAALLVEEGADVLTTYDENGGYGHPDHIQVHRVGAMAAEVAGTPVVLEATLDRVSIGRVVKALRALAWALPVPALPDLRTAYTARGDLTHRVDVRDHLSAKCESLRAHASQASRGSGDDARTLALLLRIPRLVRRRVLGYEWFRERGRPAGGDLLDDIFASRSVPGLGVAMPDGLRSRVPLLLLLACSAFLFTWQLDESGYANVYYSAAAQAGSVSWKALFFGSLDAANGLTVDKPPLALWPMGLSVRAFGLSSWSVLLPQAVEGVASVGLLYATVRRTTGQTWAAVLAGGLFAITPVSVLVFRYNIPDAMLTMLLLGAAYATIRALEGRHDSWWLVLAGTLVGLGFLTKMLEAWLVLPALWVTYVAYGHGTLARRVGRLALSAVAMLAAAGWWVAIVETWPVGTRPFIGGSPTDSVLQLALGYNGLGRLTGSTGTTAASGGLGATNIARIGRVDLGAEITWLLPAAVVLAVAAWRLSRHRDDCRVVRSAVFMWTLWLGVVCVTFSLMAGIFHSYYTVILAPAIAALVAVGSWLAWERRDEARVRQLLVAAIVVTTLVSGATVAAVGFELRWWFPVVLAAGVGAALVVRRSTADQPIAAPMAVVALAATMLGPALFTVATVRSPHVGSGPMAGPGRAATTTELVAPSAYGGFFGAYAPISDAVAAALASDARDYRWAAATLGAKGAAAYQLKVGAPVLAIGGYKGTDPAPTLHQFDAMVRDRQVHWFLPGGTYGPTGIQIEDWVKSEFEPTMIGGHVMYDLSRGALPATSPTRPSAPDVLAAEG